MSNPNFLVQHLQNLVDSLRASEELAIALADQLRDKPAETAHAEITCRALAAGLKAQAEFIEILKAAGTRRR